MRSGVRNGRDFLARMGAVFAEIRATARMSQTELAAATRLHVNTISNIERGATDPSIFAVGLLCFGLGCPRIDLDDSGLVPRFDPSARLPPKVFRGLVWTPEAVRVHSVSFRTRRLAAGLSLKDLSALAGVHLNTVWNFENARAALSATAAYRLYRAVGAGSIGGTEGVLNQGAYTAVRFHNTL